MRSRCRGASERTGTQFHGDRTGGSAASDKLVGFGEGVVDMTGDSYLGLTLVYVILLKAAAAEVPTWLRSLLESKAFPQTAPGKTHRLPRQRCEPPKRPPSKEAAPTAVNSADSTAKAACRKRG